LWVDPGGLAMAWGGSLRFLTLRGKMKEKDFDKGKIGLVYWLKIALSLRLTMK